MPLLIKMVIQIFLQDRKNQYRDLIVQAVEIIINNKPQQQYNLKYNFIKFVSILMIEDKLTKLLI